MAPALLTRTSSRGRASRISPASRRTSACARGLPARSRPRRPGRPCGSGPRSPRPSPCSAATRTTLAPSLASSRAATSPIPEVAPVTTQVLHGHRPPTVPPSLPPRSSSTPRPAVIGIVAQEGRPWLSGATSPAVNAYLASLGAPDLLDGVREILLLSAFANTVPGTPSTPIRWRAGGTAAWALPTLWPAPRQNRYWYS